MAANVQSNSLKEIETSLKSKLRERELTFAEIKDNWSRLAKLSGKKV